MRNKKNGNETQMQQPYKKLDISKHTFADRILDNCVYVDKTRFIYEMIRNESNCFLSRPRRFGKSLLLSTLKEIFSGNKELFKDCWIYDKIEWEKYNIIYIDFLELDIMNFGLEKSLSRLLSKLGNTYNIRLESESAKEKFGELIEKLAANKKVVVLIDEYDKPIIEYIKNIPEAQKNRDILKNFYSILKSKNHFIKFMLITGVSKFTKISIFSDLNHLNDISIYPQYATMLGYTKEEIEQYFSYYITEWEKQTRQNREELFKQLKDYYDGYSWDGHNFVYNPFSILGFFKAYIFRNYWFSTGSPAFLVDKLKSSELFIDEYEHLVVSEYFFEKFDIETLDVSVLLFQTGYLTIKERSDNKFVLSYPNREVREALLQCLLEGFSSKPEYTTRKTIEDINQFLNENRIDDFIQCFHVLLSSIPYNIQIEKRESYYHSLIYLALKLSMINVQCEVQTAKGRSDIVVCTDGYIYIIVLKMGDAKTALEQIKEKQYYVPYLNQNKKIILLGIGLDESDRNIGEWIAAEIPLGAKSDEIKIISEHIKKEVQIPEVQEINEQKTPDDAFEEGIKIEKRNLARRMLADNLPIELIVKYSGLSEEEIKAL